jgi:hypothetical protein
LAGFSCHSPGKERERILDDRQEVEKPYLDKMMAIFLNHLAATPRLNDLLPPRLVPLLAAGWFPRFGRCPEKTDRSVASVRYLRRFL